MNWIKLFPVATVGLMLCSCTSILNEEEPAPVVASPSQPEPTVINDRQIISQMTNKVTEIMDSGSVVEMKALIEKLKKEPKTKLQLSNDSLSGVEQAQQAVVVIGGVYKCNRCPDWHIAPASGFLIAEDLVVTNYHVVGNPDRSGLAVRLFDGRMFMVEDVVASSEQYDLAVLRLPKTGMKPIALGPSAPVGGKINLISHPNRKFYTLSEGRVARYFVMQRNRRPVSAMAITADFGKGSSGAPVLNEEGQVVGIAASTESLYYTEKEGVQNNLQMVFKNCVPVSQLRELIDG